MTVSLWWKLSQQKLKLVIFQCNKALTLMNYLGKLKRRVRGLGGGGKAQTNHVNLNTNTTTSSHQLWGNSFGLKGHTRSHSHPMLARHFPRTKIF